MCVGKVSAVNLSAPQKTRRSARKMKLMNETGNIRYEEDILATSTYYTKRILFYFGDSFKAFQESTFFKILTRTTQPAHLLTALVVIIVSFLLIPNESKNSQASPLWTLVYLGSFSAHFGAQIWMTFVSGLALYFALPRHIFGNIQQVLFPKYFLMNSVLSFITLAIFVRGHNSTLGSPEIMLQAGGMTLCFLIEMVIRLYMTAPLLRLMTIKNAIEKKAGVGSEIGKLLPGDLLNCPHYLIVHKAFRKVHMAIAMGNLVTMGCTILHLYYLSQKLCAI